MDMDIVRITPSISATRSLSWLVSVFDAVIVDVIGDAADTVLGRRHPWNDRV